MEKQQQLLHDLDMQRAEHRAQKVAQRVQQQAEHDRQDEAARAFKESQAKTRAMTMAAIDRLKVSTASSGVGCTGFLLIYMMLQGRIPCNTKDWKDGPQAQTRWCYRKGGWKGCIHIQAGHQGCWVSGGGVL